MMKKKIFPFILPFILMMIAIVAGCGTSLAEFKGCWEPVELIKDGVYQQIAVSFIEFSPEAGKLSVHGDAGVNTFNGKIGIRKNKIIPSDLAVTKMMGPPELVEFEDIFLELLTHADSYSFEGDLLTIHSSSRNLTVKLKRMK